ncbi:prolyl oligopeptidase family protein [Flavobacterium sp. 270]|uniref:alpha/beta hydrolase family protein n=1 Tax=Flavobacterium sp. 270 TaxID=2512114 RepID=UPI001065E469|nr:prolyl oligopeptidase family serine peptidase [Flavobacterium sp. 270]TDW52098.1 prolyl oligopeptidase family protein [Flavobacterium sp. 270]
MGHSFGGYETAFTITQTPMFAAAIASGAITDLVSLYYSVGRSGNPEMWRFEGEQWNMGGSPHDMPSIYAANSPLPNAVNIQSPVLLWSGKNDQQVDIHQSMEFYLALRRLKKKSIMLLYKDEGHVLIKPDNQKDITVRMIEWFNYFLKDDRSYSWIDKGMQ